MFYVWMVSNTRGGIIKLCLFSLLGFFCRQNGMCQLVSAGCVFKTTQNSAALFGDLIGSPAIDQTRNGFQIPVTSAVKYDICYDVVVDLKIDLSGTGAFCFVRKIHSISLILSLTLITYFSKNDTKCQVSYDKIFIISFIVKVSGVCEK